MIIESLLTKLKSANKWFCNKKTFTTHTLLYTVLTTYALTVNLNPKIIKIVLLIWLFMSLLVDLFRSEEKEIK